MAAPASPRPDKAARSSGRGRSLRPARRRRLDRVLAQLLCALFGLLGFLPLALGVLVRTSSVRAFAARETSALLARELGLAASYKVEVEAWPLLVALEDVRVEASDGLGPFLEVERVAVRPRPFSLLAGKLDAGDVEVIGPRLRAVVEHGAVTNLRYKVPAKSGERAAPEGRPLASLSVTDARIDLTVDGAHVVAHQVDFDASTEDDGALELGVRTGPTAVTRTHPVPGYPDEDAVDEDVICRLDARARLEGENVTVRRLIAKGSLDFDPDPGTAPSCQLVAGDWRAFDVSASGIHVRPQPGGGVTASGRVRATVPVALAHRFVKLPHATGSVTVDLEGEFDGKGRLPVVRGHVTADQVGLDGKIFSTEVGLDVATSADGVITASDVDARWADGRLLFAKATVKPFEPGLPLETSPITFEGIEFHALLRDLGVHPRAHVGWTLEKGRFESMKGTLDPVSLDGPLVVQTRAFEILSHPIVDAAGERRDTSQPYPSRGHMFGVHEPATVRGVFQVRPTAIVLNGMQVDTPRSHVRATVSLGYASFLELDVAAGSRIDLAELSPLVDIPMAGVVTVQASGRGGFDHPKFAGEMSIKGFDFGGFAAGDLESAKVAFEPLVLELTDAHLKKNESRVHASLARFAFDKKHDVLVDADVDTREGAHLSAADFFQVFHFDKDPRFEGIAGVVDGRAHLHYALNGPEDTCGGGLLQVKTAMELAKVELFGERYPSGSVDLDMTWDDQAAGDAGMTLDVRALTLRKGTGSLLGTVAVRHGGILTGTAIATGLPLSSVDAIGPIGKQLDGTASFVATLGGTTRAVEANADVSVSRLRIGTSSLPASRFHFAMDAARGKAKRGDLTRCHDPRAAPFSQADFERDESAGALRFDGQLFDGQIKLSNVAVTRQKHKVVTGQVAVSKLDLGTLANLIPGIAFSSGAPPRGTLSASLDVKSFPVDAPSHADVTLTLDALEVERDHNSARLLGKSGAIVLRDNHLEVPELRVEARGKSGISAVLVAGGDIKHATTAPELDLGVRVEPIDLARLPRDVPGVERAGGAFDADLHVSGPVAQLKWAGAAHLRKGELNTSDPPLAFDEVNVDLEVVQGDLRIKRATARLGGGTIEITGRMPLRGRDAFTATATLTAHGVRLNVAEGVNFTTDAEIEATYAPGAKENGQRNIPEVKGTVSLVSFNYTRPIVLSLDLAQLSRPQRTNVDTYDPANDVVHFNLNVVSPRPLRIANNLIDMQLDIVDPGIMLSGTNQRFGARGLLRLLSDSKLHLRGNDFTVKEGFVRFDDPTRIAPSVDMRATTEYRRYSSSAAQDSAASAVEGAGASSATNPGSMTTAATIASNGIWRINLHAHGDAENLKVDLTSDPVLSQEDIVLLLTVGMTHAELDRSQGALGESVGLEALSSLTGADTALAKAVPVIDEFRFGSWYSTLSGQIEPTVTLGKRVNESVRGEVTTGVTDNREVRSTLEWKLSKHLSVEGTYDNLSEVSDSALGNVGADLRWHIEFE
ncbi:MAG TPA: translocation/assembly module TamB domain-containing protein [Byssovorax sp.]